MLTSSSLLENESGVSRGQRYLALLDQPRDNTHDAAPPHEQSQIFGVIVPSMHGNDCTTWTIRFWRPDRVEKVGRGVVSLMGVGAHWCYRTC